MDGEKKESRSIASRIMEGVCEQLPNCTKAIDIAEIGAERNLTKMEKIRLKYHGRLCPFCGCAAGKFEAAKHNLLESNR